MSAARGYDQDFFAWLSVNAQLIRERRFDEMDADHIAEELEAMGKTEKRELMNRLALLLMHLLKWQYQAPRRTRSWRNTIAIQRQDIEDLLQDSPSLRPLVAGKIQDAYDKATLKAENETGIERASFPQECPYTLDQVLAEDFFPSESIEGGVV